MQPAKTGTATYDQSAYFKAWYAKNRDRLIRKRRKRYDCDPAYRERAREWARQWYADPKNRARKLALQKSRHRTRPQAQIRVRQGASYVEIPVYRLGELARVLGLSKVTLQAWERTGVLPEATHRTAAGWRLYTDTQVECIAETYKETHHVRDDRLARFAELLKVRWARMPKGVGHWRDQ